jgi:uncharacterized protein YebE (UPF0316 family)
VSLGTVRTIAIVHGRTITAFLLGFVEISVWLFVISSVIGHVAEKPLLGFFYALGYATGNAVGIKLERFLPLGNVILRIISVEKGHEIADSLRREGFAVTLFEGEGQSGPVTENLIVCRRRDVNRILNIVHSVEPEPFFMTEPAGDVSWIHRPFMTPTTGWRAVLKRK